MKKKDVFRLDMDHAGLLFVLCRFLYLSHQPYFSEQRV